jgi:transcriptional regulator with XRE-family HTH domain
MSYAAAIAKARKQAKLSQRRLSLLAGFDESYVCLLESGKRTPSIDAVGAIAEAAGVTAAQIHVWAAEMGPKKGRREP